MKTRNTTMKHFALALGALAAILVVWNVYSCFVLAWPGLAAIPPTPGATYSFDTGTGASQIGIGGSPADANVAASSTHVCVTARAAFACYTKGGALVGLGAGFDARPYLASDFFTQSGISVGPPFSGAGTRTKDGRIVFDKYRKRFFMDFQSRENPGRLLIAVSKSEDPRDGWWTYADNIANANANNHDYQWIGINATYFLISENAAKCSNSTGTWACANGATRHFMYTAADLAAGKPYTRTEWSDPSANRAVPCVHDTYTTDAFWVHRDDNTHATVWAVRNGKATRRQVSIQPSTAAVNGTQLGGNILAYDLFAGAPPPPLNAQYHSGRIVFVSNDGHTWAGQSTPSNAVRLVRLNVSNYFDTSQTSPTITVEIDRVFGRAAAGDPSGAIYDYGWPAVAANDKGDIVVGSVRSRSTIYPELRASVWFAGQPDISSGVSLATSSSPLSDWHMAGASADPSTDGVYLAQMYGSSSPSWRIRVVKMLGKVLPDVIATKVQPPVSIAHGVPGNVMVTVMNQGDGPSPASTGRLYLSTDNAIDLLGPDIKEDPSLTTFSVPALAPNQVATLTVPFTIGRAQPGGAYFVGVALSNDASEYSKTNNVNPFLGGNHGNAPITVK